MNGLSKEQSSSREKTLRTSLLLSAPGPLVTGWALISSHSTTQFADFLRRGVELVAIFISWWVFRQFQRNPALSDADRARLERMAGLSVAGAMFLSGIGMLILALSRLSAYEPGGRVTAGLIIAVLGLVTNGWFWWRYAALTREQYSAVIDAQQRLYRAKTSVDFCVVAALTAVAVAPNHPATRYVDILGSVVVAGYLLWSGLRMAQIQPAKLKELFSRSNERTVQVFPLPVEVEEEKD
jgi:divalent metal cation (Fe/Co/Zn/Cd) transporter